MQVVRADRPLPVVASRPRFAALANDGPRDAAAARDAAQAFQRYVEGLAKAGARPDLTRPDVAKLLRQVFNVDALMALPTPQASDVAWTMEWNAAADHVSSMILTYGAGPRSGLEAAAVQRNLAEYEDHYAAAMNFSIRLYAHQAVAFNLALARLSPQQRTPAQVEAVKQVRTGAAEMIVGAIQSIVLTGTPAIRAWSRPQSGTRATSGRRSSCPRAAPTRCVWSLARPRG